jgi:hypothetical protein
MRAIRLVRAKPPGEQAVYGQKARAVEKNCAGGALLPMTCK